MSKDGFDYSELTKWDRELLRFSKNYPKLCKKHVKQATAKGVKIVRATFKGFGKKSKIKPFTFRGKVHKNYASTFTSSKYGYKDGADWSARIWNRNPLSHIIEGEHVHTGHKPKKVRTGTIVKGFHTFEKAKSKVEQEFVKHLRDKMVDDIRKQLKK